MQIIIVRGCLINPPQCLSAYTLHDNARHSLILFTPAYGFYAAIIVFPIWRHCRADHTFKIKYKIIKFTSINM